MLLSPIETNSNSNARTKRKHLHKCTPTGSTHNLPKPPSTKPTKKQRQPTSTNPQPSKRNNLERKQPPSNTNLLTTESKYNLNPKLTPSETTTHQKPSIKVVGHMLPRNRALKHEAAAELLQYATNGCPVNCGEQWSIKRLQAAIDAGPCTSASSKEAIQACRKEILEKVNEGHCRIIDWNDIKDNPHKNLKISPIAAIQHKSRLFRMILHLAFQIEINKEKLLSVNDTTDHTLAPQHSMYELGNVIPRIIWSLARAPDTGVPILFSKIDLKDGYWRMIVNEHEVWNFAYVLQSLNKDDPIQIVIPNAL